MLEACAVSFRTRDHLLLDDISFSARTGELTVVIGPNGAGKSTLLAMLSGFQTPSSGQVRINGFDPAVTPARKLARLRAVVEQQAGWQPGLSALELVMMGAYLAPKSGASWQEAMRLAQCIDLADRPLETLSGGERQRVHLARALLQLLSSQEEERFLLLDEPTAALDFGLADTLMAQVRMLAQDLHLGVIAVVHDLNLTLRHADRVLLMQNGRAAAFGATADVMQKHSLEALYGVRLAELVNPDDAQMRAFVPMHTHSA